MNRATKQHGHLLFAVIVLLVFAGLSLSAVGNSVALRAQFDHTAQVHDQRALLHAKESLLSHATAQGLQTQSQLGSLPCPALLPDSHPQTTCNNKPWGYLPARSNAKVNFLQPGVATTQAVKPMQQQRAWQYAVSQQVIQPNALGWSQWVNWAAPPMTLHVEGASPHTLQDVAAVVSQGLELLYDHTYRITPPYVVIDSHELRQHTERAEQAAVEQALLGWQHNNPSPVQALQWHHENLIATNEPHLLQPQDSACACRCTKTRCTCECAQTGLWQSDSPCDSSLEHCLQQADGQYVCYSTPGQPCVFKGAAQLQSRWPVSHFEPLPAAHRACRPTALHICPLSDQTQACECKFSWPEQTLNGLAAHKVQLRGGQIQVIRSSR